MKVSCILTSFNRPKFVRQALRSVEMQTHTDYELFVMDESTLFDIHTVVKEFKFPSVTVRHFKVSPDVRAKQSRMAIKINEALKEVKGDLVCYLCDDDYYFPNWFKDSVEFFQECPNADVAFGILLHKTSDTLDLTPIGKRRFFTTPVTDPSGKLNHNQVIHRRLDPPLLWPEDKHCYYAPDAYYFTMLANAHIFYPLDTLAAVRRDHPMGFQNTVNAHMSGNVEGARE